MLPIRRGVALPPRLARLEPCLGRRFLQLWASTWDDPDFLDLAPAERWVLVCIWAALRETDPGYADAELVPLFENQRAAVQAIRRRSGYTKEESQALYGRLMAEGWLAIDSNGRVITKQWRRYNPIRPSEMAESVKQRVRRHRLRNDPALRVVGDDQ